MLVIFASIERDSDRVYLVTPDGRRIGFIRQSVLTRLAQVQDFGPRELVPVDLQTSGKGDGGS